MATSFSKMMRDASLMAILTLSQLLDAGQSEFYIYDLGRRLQAIETSEFNAIEAQQAPYPFPLQGHAWLAIVFWSQAAEGATEPFLWFLKFPLDERGLLDLQAQQGFITQVLTLLGNKVTGALNEEQRQQLQQSPYLFTPAEEKRAALHARLTKRLEQPPSVHYETAESALAQPEAPQWQQIGLQGLHDVAARLHAGQRLSAQIADNFHSYPQPLQRALAIALEHQSSPQPLTDALAKRVLSEAQPGEQRLNLLRSCASASHTEAVRDAVAHCLGNPDQDELVLIPARMWSALQPGNEKVNLLELYMLRLAEYPAMQAERQNNQLFAALTADLLRLPAIRPHLLSLLRRHDLPLPLQRAWRQFTGVSS
ncbi:DUF3549 family protein [Pseudidiomarina sp.]|uniref:DUF3549 family protein n=1 Tax=Pseudidiomarina sp. TaxID=2081707 RepID=UPI00299E70B3|nr:DUF3549 family protein [Pseudidiomarina sp.]MDX1704856.1 DUF3549 family protein [Pseudidiomarina sp.]